MSLARGETRCLWLAPNGLAWALLCLLLLTPLTPASADEPASPESTKHSNWIVTLGGFGDLEPRFEGARQHAFGLHPIIDYRAEGTREWLNLPNDGFDFALIETPNFRFGPVVNGRWQRDTGTLTRGFRQLGSIDLSAEGGVFAEWWPSDALRTRVEAREAFFGASGLVADLSIDWVWHPDQKWTLNAGPRLSLADATFMRSYYSIDPQQSISSGFPPYAAPAGVRSMGVGSMVRYKWTENVATMAFGEYQRLAPAAADSPLIAERGSPNQLTIGLGLSYSFVVAW